MICEMHAFKDQAIALLPMDDHIWYILQFDTLLSNVSHKVAHQRPPSPYTCHH